MAARWKATNSGWEMRLRIDGESVRVAEVYESGAEIRWWVFDVADGWSKTEASAKRAAERAMVKHGRRLVKAGGGE